MPGRVFLPWALAFTAIYVVSARTGVLNCFGLRVLFLYFYFKYLALLVLLGPIWNSTRDNIDPKPFLLFSSFDSYRPYLCKLLKFFALIFAVFSQILSKFLLFDFMTINLFAVFRIPPGG